MAKNKSPNTFLSFHEAAHELFSCSWSHHVRAVGVGAGGVRLPAVVFELRIEAVVLSGSQQRLQGLDVADCVSQDLHFWQSLVWVGGRAAFQRFKSIIDFTEPPPLSHGCCFPTVCMSCLSLAGLAGPKQAVARLVEAPRGPHMLVLLLCRRNMVVKMVLGLQQAAVCQAGVQVIKKVQIAGGEGGVIEVVS